MEFISRNLGADVRKFNKDRLLATGGFSYFVHPSILQCSLIRTCLEYMTDSVIELRVRSKEDFAICSVSILHSLCLAMARVNSSNSQASLEKARREKCNLARRRHYYDKEQREKLVEPSLANRSVENLLADAQQVGARVIECAHNKARRITREANEVALSILMTAEDAARVTSAIALEAKQEAVSLTRNIQTKITELTEESKEL